MNEQEIKVASEGELRAEVINLSEENSELKLKIKLLEDLHNALEVDHEKMAKTIIDAVTTQETYRTIIAEKNKEIKKLCDKKEN